MRQTKTTKQDIPLKTFTGIIVAVRQVTDTSKNTVYVIDAEMAVSGNKKTVKNIPLPVNLTSLSFTIPLVTHLAPYTVVCTTSLDEPLVDRGLWTLELNSQVAFAMQQIVLQDSNQQVVKSVAKNTPQPSMSITASDPTTNRQSPKDKAQAIRDRANQLRQDIPKPPDVRYGRNGTALDFRFGIPPELDEQMARGLDKIDLYTFGKLVHLAFDNFKYQNLSSLIQYPSTSPFEIKFNGFKFNSLSKYLASTAVKPIQTFIHAIESNLLSVGTATAIAVAISAIKGKLPKAPEGRATLDVLGARFTLRAEDIGNSPVRPGGPYS